MTFGEEINQIINSALQETSLFMENNFGKGGIANQSGSTAPNPGVPSGNAVSTTATSVSPNAQPKFAGNPQHPVTNPTLNPNGGQTATPGVEDETMEFSKLLQLKNTDPAKFNNALKPIASDNAKFGRFVDYINQQSVPTK